VDVDLSSLTKSNRSGVAKNKKKQSSSSDLKQETELLSNTSEALNLEEFQVRVVNQLHEQNQHDVFVAMESVADSVNE